MNIIKSSTIENIKWALALSKMDPEKEYVISVFKCLASTECPKISANLYCICLSILQIYT